ncbi:MAG: 1,4-dihydroxy-2-naphthoyl-CoA hydrolase [Candidatus Dichloromethanomonas elyunquensis]|nr:MAG: 1,4-dihydroxy-2-naphthoyl-CoA hydrolase [Candidatus Dichloromethanomonas elyunquensis]
MNLIEGLNIEYINVQEDTFEAKMNLTQFHSQNLGFLHGGAMIAFGETVSGYASNQKVSSNRVAMGQTIVANHMKPKKTEGYILAMGKLMHQGKTSHVWGIEMYDEKGRLLSYLTVTNAIVSAVIQE